MTESTNPEIDPEEFFNEGFEAGRGTVSDEFLDDLSEKLTDELGFDPDEVDELLYDPAPRRGRRRRRSRTSAPVQAPRRKRRKARTYAQTTGRKGRGRTGRQLKGMLGKFKQYAFPIAAGGSFLMQYAARADALKAAGSITTGGYAGILEAIKFDLTNFNASAAMTRVSSNISTIGVPLVGGYLVKKVGGGFVKGGVEKDVVEIVGDLLTGYGVATGVKKILDPPINVPQQQPQQQQQPQNTYVPWGY